MVRELEELEESGTFSNFGPINTRFERAAIERLFGGQGACLTVCNATIGLMIAIRDAVGPNANGRRYALMPSFTFAAAAQAALWCGLTPLFCDIDPDSWLPSGDAENALLDRYKGEIALIFPYATFGNDLDLARYQELSAQHGVPLVIDAAASLGSMDGQGHGFGTGFAHPIVFSLHATKPFATSEGGLIYAADLSTIGRLRAMANFGFAQPRVSSLLGLNAKMPEIGALLALAKLEDIVPIVERREAVFARYRAKLPGWAFQRHLGSHTAHTFVPVLLPDALAGRRAEILRGLAEHGIGAATYFSPHLAEHSYFRDNSVSGDLSVTEKIAGAMLTLPLFDEITDDQIDYICRTLTEMCC
jgi:dTDP-4-amino-4,6-dideoxygalactose transaminase